MADCMTFPETVNGFFEQYGIWDREEVYTNGALLIPVFRVEQMIDHYFPERFPERTCHDTDKNEWHFTCSNCGYEQNGYESWNYCANCGAKVEQ